MTAVDMIIVHIGLSYNIYSNEEMKLGLIIQIGTELIMTTLSSIFFCVMFTRFSNLNIKRNEKLAKILEQQ